MNWWTDQLDEEREFYRTMDAEAEREFLEGVVVPQPFSVRLTCISCPEQWAIFSGDTHVGYLRCRHSKWSLSYPDVGGEVLLAEPWHPEGGGYESNFDEERPAIFDRVFAALAERITR